jgi:hypothetical protein
MKLQRTALGLLVIAALFAGVVAVYEQQQKGVPATDVDQSASQRVFDFSEAAIALVTIETRRPAVTIARLDGQWRLSAPLKVPANPATVAFLTNLLTTAQRDRTLNLSRDRAAEFGLDQPTGTIIMTLTDQKQHKLVLGKLSFDRTFLYALIDPDPNAKELSVSLISPQFVNAVDRDLGEWQVDKKVDKTVATPTAAASATPEIVPPPLPSAAVNPSPPASPLPQTSPKPEASPPVKP